MILIVNSCMHALFGGGYSVDLPLSMVPCDIHELHHMIGCSGAGGDQAKLLCEGGVAAFDPARISFSRCDVLGLLLQDTSRLDGIQTFNDVVYFQLPRSHRGCFSPDRKREGVAQSSVF